jgi:SAM-dependent methyltransferase
VDINRAHLHLTRLKLAALRGLPDHEDFFQFFGVAKGLQNVRVYQNRICQHLDTDAHQFWEGRRTTRQKRIQYFDYGFYDRTRFGLFLLGIHGLSQVVGRHPRRLLQARSMEDQGSFFETEVVPFFDRTLIKWLSRHAISVLGLGIPPRQHRVLNDESDGQMAALARKQPQTRLLGLDASGQMLKTAVRSVRQAGLSKHIVLRQGLAENFDPRHTFGTCTPFDTIFFSYSLSMIPAWPLALTAAFQHLKPKGRLYIVDFFDQADLPGWFAGLLTRWLRHFGVVHRPELLGHLVGLAQRNEIEIDIAPLYRRYAFIVEATKMGQPGD